MAFDKIGFIGLGLIGGSIAKKIKKDRNNVSIIATAGHLATITEAYKDGIIDNDTLLPLTAFADCDYIFLCAPVQRNLAYLEELAGIIKPQCCITDVGSTKGDIHRKVLELGLTDQFIGGHPMTGSEKTGITNANEYLLENAYYIITPTNTTPPERIEEFRSFVESLGSIPMVLDYDVHDFSTAAISHLPHMIAFSLVNLVKQKDNNEETMKTIAAGGFKDITRIASSSPVMWENICESNQTQLLKLMDLYIEELQQLRTSIADSDADWMMEYFQSAKDYRDSITLTGRKSTISVFEVFVDLKDEAGGIAAITALLADSDISLKNIGIINNREFEEGALRLELYDAESKESTISVLTSHGYHLFDR